MYDDIVCMGISITIFGVLYEDARLKDILFAFAYPSEFKFLIHVYLWFLYLFCHLDVVVKPSSTLK